MSGTKDFIYDSIDGMKAQGMDYFILCIPKIKKRKGQKTPRNKALVNVFFHLKNKKSLSTCISVLQQFIEDCENKQ